MGGIRLPHITFRFSRSPQSSIVNNQSYYKTIDFYNNLIKDIVDEKNIIIINKYLEVWVNCILSNPTLFNKEYLTEFFTSSAFPDFVINGSIQIDN